MTKREFCHIWCIDRIYSGVYNMVKLMKSLNYKYDWMKILVILGPPVHAAYSYVSYRK